MRPFVSAYATIRVGLCDRSCRLMRPFMSPYTYISMTLHIYTHHPDQLYVCVIRSRPNNLDPIPFRQASHFNGHRATKDISAHKLNAISVHIFSTRQLTLLPLFAGKVRLLNWVIKCYASGGYSFYFLLASTISWKVLQSVKASKRQAEKLSGIKVEAIRTSSTFVIITISVSWPLLSLK